MLGQTLMLTQVHISVSLSLGYLDQSHLKTKRCTGTTESTSRPFVSKKIVDVEEGQNQETIETRGVWCEGMVSFYRLVSSAS